VVLIIPATWVIRYRLLSDTTFDCLMLCLLYVDPVICTHLPLITLSLSLVPKERFSVSMFKRTLCRYQWDLKKGLHFEISLAAYPKGLRLRSAAGCLLGFGFKPPENGYLSVCLSVYLFMCLCCVLSSKGLRVGLGETCRV